MMPAREGRRRGHQAPPDDSATRSPCWGMRSRRGSSSWWCRVCGSMWIQPQSWSVGLEIGTAAILFAVMWVAVLWAVGLYRIGARWSLLGEARDIVKATVVALDADALPALPDASRQRQPRFPRRPLCRPADGDPGRQGTAAVLVDMAAASGPEQRTTCSLSGPAGLAQAFADRVEAHRGLGLRVVGHLRRSRPVGHSRGKGAEPKLASRWPCGLRRLSQ